MKEEIIYVSGFAAVIFDQNRQERLFRIWRKGSRVYFAEWLTSFFVLLLFIMNL
jgi:hypothetical protein